MNDTKAVRIASVKYAGGYSLLLRWVSGARTLVDLSIPVHRMKGLWTLRNEDQFAMATRGEGGHSVTWPGDLDLGADRLWELALEELGRDDALEFMHWRSRHGLSLTQAAEALGISRRQAAYYASGTHPVPRMVLLACKGWATELLTTAPRS